MFGLILKENGKYRVIERLHNQDYGEFDSPETAEKFCENYFGTEWGWA